MDIIEENMPYSIGIFAADDFAVMSYAGVTDPLRAANLLNGSTLYDVTHFGLGAICQSSSAAQIVPDKKVGEFPKLDYLFVIAGGSPESFNDKKALNWLAGYARRGTVICGVSGGPVILAKAGLMSARRMTVHWEHAAALAEVAPDLKIERNLFVVDGNRITCAGGTAPLDLMHRLISDHQGKAFALRVSDWFMHTDIRLASGAQRGGLVERIGTTNAPILDAVEMMDANISEPVSLDDLASFSNRSKRQLNRLFGQTLGCTTMEYYRRIRLEKAQNLLRNSALTLTEISLATGFSSSSHFSRVFLVHFGYPPSKERHLV
ncbi:MAG: GlxA family transcriptional regulator [Paracoccaceae bacterium]|nr:GlxA family transcriptional regulator [Paracoccaceae bacterium]